MKNRILYTFILSLIFSVTSCSNEEEVVPIDEPSPGSGTYRPLPLEDYSNGSGVMMQAFYWDVEPRHEWWDLLSGKVEGWSNAGIDRIWLPPATKGQSGGYSMGYDVSDYFDFGQYQQHGTVATRFGTKEALKNLIAAAHQNGLEVIADIVLNHNSGGGEEFNPYRNKITYTNFDTEHGNASGMFDRNYENFYPNSTSPVDEGSLFYEEQNLDHNQEYVQKWLWKDETSVAKYYRNEMGFDGWRFDYVLGFEPWVVKEWNAAVGGFSVAELWDGNVNLLKEYVEETGSGVFDFTTFYKLEEALDRNDDLNKLSEEMLWNTYPEKAVTFTANHDTEKDTNEDNRISAENKMKAYSFILTHPGYPTIFYSDYENEELQQELKQLIKIHNSLATGAFELLYVDDDEYIMKRTGNADNPGLILYITTNGSTKRREIATGWNNIQLMDYSENSSYKPMTAENGTASIEAPANGYAVWSIME